jgi:hypothetical protein
LDGKSSLPRSSQGTGIWRQINSVMKLKGGIYYVTRGESPQFRNPAPVNWAGIWRRKTFNTLNHYYEKDTKKGWHSFIYRYKAHL